MEIHCIPGIGFDSNVYIIMEADRAILVDTGTGAYNKHVLDNIRALGLLGKFDGIILTHRHVDHSGGARALATKLGCRIYSGKDESAILRKGNDESTCALDVGIDLPPMEIDDLDNDFRIGSEILKVINAPGHTDGHIVLYHNPSRALLCGDVIFCDGGVGRWDLPSGDYKALLKTVKMLSQLGVNSLYPGHGTYTIKDGDDHITLALKSLESWGTF